MTRFARHLSGSVVRRAAALTVGAFIFANLVGEARRARFSTLDAWLPSPVAGVAGVAGGPAWLGDALAIAAAVVLLGYGLVPRAFELSRTLRRVGAGVLALVTVVALVATAIFYVAVARAPRPDFLVVPAALVVAATFAVFAKTVARAHVARAELDSRRAVVALATMAATTLALPLLQIVTSGPFRDEHAADCAVVLGARVKDDGTPSDALADRVDEGVALYRRGLVRCVVMSGAVDPYNGFSEPVVMKGRAVANGVAADDVLLDEGGVDTASTARNVSAMLRGRGLHRALIVTHYYHEPRTKFLFVRAGIEAYSVPTTMTRRLLKEPYFVLREIAAYYHSFLLE